MLNRDCYHTKFERNWFVNVQALSNIKLFDAVSTAVVISLDSIILALKRYCRTLMHPTGFAFGWPYNLLPKSRPVKMA